MEFVFLIIAIVFILICNSLYDRNKNLKKQIIELQKNHNSQSINPSTHTQMHSNLCIDSEELKKIILSYTWIEANNFYSNVHINPKELNQNEKITLRDQIRLFFKTAFEEQYKFRLLISIYPELENVFSDNNILVELPSKDFKRTDYCEQNLFGIVNIIQRNQMGIKEKLLLKNRVSFLENAQSNLTAIPYMAAIMADYETYGLEMLAKELDWGYDKKRIQKVKSIREIRQVAKEMIQRNKEAQYQLAYLLKLFPNLEDVIECEFKQLPIIDVTTISEYDSVREYLTHEEYEKLSVTERNQLALDRYMNSHKKTKWQIGRDYELYCGHIFSKKGYQVDYFGSYKGLEDLGRDIIATKNDEVVIAQCKYWSKQKQIHEKHINQLYGTMICYCIEHNLNSNKVTGMLITNISLSPMAKKMADMLNIKYVENVTLGAYPCIKCNIGHSSDGPTKIYHLPFDQQYDSTVIDEDGEFFAMTIAEAEAAGFRRAFKWFGNK